MIDNWVRILKIETYHNNDGFVSSMKSENTRETFFGRGKTRNDSVIDLLAHSITELETYIYEMHMGEDL